MKRIYKKLMTLSALAVATAGSLDAQCTYTVNAYDSWGDGWNGGTLSIDVNGTVSNYTLSSGSSGTYNFTVNTGDPLTISYTSGSYAGEVTYNIVDNVGQLVVDYPSQGTFSGVVFSGVGECVTCGVPQNVTASYVDNDTIIIDWNASIIGAVDYTLEYGPEGFTPGTGTIHSGITDLTDTIAGLSQVTSYDFYVFTNCGVDSSNVVGPLTYLTLPNCAAPTGLTATVLSPDSVALAWTAGSTGETEWVLEYGVSGYTPGTGTSVVVTTTAMDTVTGLTQNTAYDFYIQGVCSLSDSSLWVGPQTASTPLYCGNVSNLSATVVGDTAFLSWNGGVDGETMWNVEYGVSGFSLGSGTSYVTSNNAPDTLFGLDLGTAYQFYVQASCASGDTSLFVGPFGFYTSAGNDEACDAIVVPVDGVTRTFGNYDATSAGEPGNTSYRTVWFEFTVPTSGHVAIATCGTPFDTELSVFETGATCGDYLTFTEIAYADFNPFNNCSGSHPAGVEMCGLTPGASYFLKVGDYYSSGSFNSFPLTLWDLGVDAGVGSSTTACVGDTVNLTGLVSGTVSETMGYYEHTGNPLVIYNDSLAVTGNIPANGSVIYVVENLCMSDTAIITLNVVQPASSGTAVSPFNACNSDVYLPDGLTGTVDAGGTWSDDSGTGLLGGAGNNVFVGGLAPVGTYPFTYTVDNGVCTPSSTSITVTINDCTGIVENEGGYGVYPNPNEGTFFITSEISEVVMISVLDVQGKVVYSKEVNLTNNAPVSISLSEVESGLYFVRVASQKNVSTTSIIVK